MQDLIPYGVLTLLGLGAIGLFSWLVQLVRSSIRTSKPRTGAEPDRIREIVASTRSSLMELQAILSSEIGSGGFGTTSIAGASLMGRAEVELLQKVRKYQLVKPETREEAVKIH